MTGSQRCLFHSIICHIHDWCAVMSVSYSSL